MIVEQNGTQVVELYEYEEWVDGGFVDVATFNDCVDESNLVGEFELVPAEWYTGEFGLAEEEVKNVWLFAKSPEYPCGVTLRPCLLENGEWSVVDCDGTVYALLKRAQHECCLPQREDKMEKTDTKITRYKEGKWLIDIVEDDTMFEASLMYACYGVSMYMFGLMKKDVSLDQFMEIVVANLPEYKKNYQDDYMDV